MSRAALSESPECLRLEAAASPSARVAVSGARTAHLPPPHHRYKRDKYLGLAGSSRLTPVCLDPEYTTPGQINFGCKEAAKLFHNANTVFKAGTCDLATLEAEYGDEEEEQAKSLEELSPVTCADFCSSNPCCTLYKEDADDCILFGGSCVESNRDSSEEADAAGMFLAIERTTTFEDAEEESAAFSDLVAVGNVIDAPQTPGTIFTVCEGEANSVDVQLTSTDAKDAMATLLLIGSKPQAADMEGRRLQATDTDEEFSFKGTKLNATEVVRLLTQLKEDIDIDSASTTLSPDQFEEVFASETARNTLLLAVFGLPPPPPCPNLTFPVKFASPSPSPPGVAYCPENEITNLSAPVLCGSYTSLTGGRDKTALRLKRVSSVPSADVCKAKCCKTVGCMSFTYSQGGKDEGRCDLYTVKVTEAAGFVPIPEDKDPNYVSASRNSVGPPSPPASPPSCQYFPEWAEGRANLRETGDADLMYCWQLTAERIDECDKFFYFTEHGVEGQMRHEGTRRPGRLARLQCKDEQQVVCGRPLPPGSTRFAAASHAADALRSATAAAAAGRAVPHRARQGRRRRVVLRARRKRARRPLQELFHHAQRQVPNVRGACRGRDHVQRRQCRARRDARADVHRARRCTRVLLHRAAVAHRPCEHARGHGGDGVLLRRQRV